MDVMGVAFDYAVHDIRGLVGMYTEDTEEYCDDEITANFSTVISEKYIVKGSESDTTLNGPAD